MFVVVVVAVAVAVAVVVAEVGLVSVVPAVVVAASTHDHI